MSKIIVPTRELSDGFVVGMFRMFQCNGNPFVGDILARHAPRTSQQYAQVLEPNSRLNPLTELVRLETSYMREMIGFTRGLIIAAMDEAICQHTEWGRLNNPTRFVIDDYLSNNTHGWDLHHDSHQSEFREELLEEFIDRLNRQWTPQLKKHPERMWYGQMNSLGDLCIEAGPNHYTVEQPASEPAGEDQSSMYLDEDFAKINEVANGEVARLRRRMAGQIDDIRRADPFYLLYFKTPLNNGTLRPLPNPPQRSEAKAFAENLYNPGAWRNGIVAIRRVEDECQPDTENNHPYQKRHP